MALVRGIGGGDFRLNRLKSVPSGCHFVATPAGAGFRGLRAPPGYQAAGPGQYQQGASDYYREVGPRGPRIPRPRSQSTKNSLGSALRLLEVISGVSTISFTTRLSLCDGCVAPARPGPFAVMRRDGRSRERE